MTDVAPALRVEGLWKSFGELDVLQGIDPGLDAAVVLAFAGRDNPLGGLRRDGRDQLKHLG